MKPIETQDATLSVDGHIATLTFERDDVRNALTGTGLLDDIVRTIEWANSEPDLAVLVLTGAGKAFSAGGNVKEMREGGGMFAGSVGEVEAAYREGIQRIPLAMHGAEFVTIAAVNGPAIGAGCDLAMMCDLRIGSTGAAFGETFVNLGIIPGDGGAWFLQRLIGYQLAADMTFRGRIVRAEEAREIGLLLELVEPSALVPRALEMAGEIAAKPPQALRYAKRLMKLAQRTELPDFLDYCAVIQGVCHGTEDHGEAVAAFLDKRAPNFKGQ
ncbi:MAG: enoyl-CoA hydratase-related protein [Alphaproteobacteria bacterium]